MIIPIERFVALVDAERKSSHRAANYFEALTTEVNRSTLLKGNGSPEGVIEAIEDVRYLDLTGTIGSRMYIKTNNTGSTGWVLI